MYLIEIDVCDSDGWILVELVDIEKVECGVFVIKLFNGFVLIIKKF